MQIRYTRAAKLRISSYACFLCLCRYSSQVYLTEPLKVLSKVSDSTLFDHLDTTWEFKPGPTPSTTWLNFDVDFAFKSPLYRHIASIFFDEASPYCLNQHDKGPRCSDHFHSLYKIASWHPLISCACLCLGSLQIKDLMIPHAAVICAVLLPYNFSVTKESWAFASSS